MTTAMAIPTHGLSFEAIEAAVPATSKLVDMILLLAIKDLATSVTFEPRQKDYRLSYRCNGKDYEMVPPPRNRAARISQSFKILARLDHRNRQTPQEGLVRCLVDDESADVRISIQPTRFGESVHLTIENNTTKWERAQALLAEAAGPPLCELDIGLG
jgi:type IV pilus assembly protein PilB